jgi:hypothetical protein
MNWKKFLLIGLAIGALAFTAAPRAEAGVSVGIGFGFPGCYGYGYPAYYPYGYGYYGGGYYGGYYGPRRVVYVAPRSYWHHGRRVYLRNRNWR